MVFDSKSDDPETRRLLADATGRIKELRAELKLAQAGKQEPIAIVGMACRFPGGEDAAGYWRLLSEGRHAVVDGTERWRESGQAPPRSGITWAALLNNVSHFDAEFFNLSPREVEKMDPQQRLVLEVAWEAFENAGYPARALAGSRTGVFMGSCSSDYEQVLLAAGQFVDPHSVTGTTAVAATSGRISYLLGLRGPCINVDTACSSALVGVHLASQSLRNRECNLAVAGAVQLILSPLSNDMLAETHALSRTGRGKTFDARADGYVRGEGIGVVVLKRLSDALRDGDQIHALVRGSAVNQDGASASFTSPSPLAQREVIAQALQAGDVQAQQVSYVEAHGTGTPVGDPIEIEALHAAYGAPRPDGSRCVVGTAKTNIGHAEAAAGMAGLFKVILAMRHESIPKILNFETLNPLLPLHDSALSIATEPRAWPRGAQPRLAGISAFGMTGTNAHVIVQEPPVREVAAQADAGEAHILPLSGRTPKALREAAARLTKHLQAPENAAQTVASIAAMAGVHRTPYEYRLTVTGSTKEAWAGALTAWRRGETDSGLASSDDRASEGRRVVFMFPGQGSQWLGMGRELLAREPAFRSAMEACDAAVRAHTGWSVIEELQADASRSRLEQVNVVQPVLFAMQVALAAQWRAWGIEPAAVVGHSMGEAAAAHVAGILSLEEASKIICVRSDAVRRAGVGRGAMLVVELTVPEAEALLQPYAGKVTIAAFNGERSQLLSGDIDAVQAIVATLTEAKTFCRLVRVDFASHSPHVDAVLPTIEKELGTLHPGRGTVAFHSTVLGERVDGTALDTAYWLRNLRQPVQFARVLADLQTAGYRTFVEVSPHPVLPPLPHEAASAAVPRVVVASLRRDRPERATLLNELGRLFVAGLDVPWQKLQRAPQPKVALPTYPWQRQHYWVQPGKVTRGRTRAAADQAMLGKPTRVASHPDDVFFETELSVADFPYLADHRVGEAVVVPGACYSEMMLAAGRAVLGAGKVRLDDVALREMLVLPADESQTVQIILEGGGRVRVYSRLGTGWVLHAEGRVSRAAETPVGRTALPAAPAETIAGDALYARFAAAELHYGPAFRGVTEGWRQGQEAWARLRVINPSAGYMLHPALLDAALQATGLLSDAAAGGNPWLPVGMGQVIVCGNPERAAWVHVRRANAAEGTAPLTDLDILDGEGAPVVQVRALRVQQLGNGALAGQKHADLFLQQRWERLPPLEGESDAKGNWLLLGGDATGLSQALRRALVRRGGDVVEVLPTAGWEQRVAEALQQQSQLRGVIHLWSVTGDAPHTASDLRAAQALGCASVISLAQALALRPQLQPRLWLVSNGVQRIDDEDATVAAHAAPLWGMGRTVALEHPDWRTSCVDVRLGGDVVNLESTADALAHEVCASDADTEVALRAGGARYGCRLMRSPPPRAATLTLEPSATYLITGGLGGLGLELAKWLVAQGARHLMLVGRHVELTGARKDAVEGLRVSGADVQVRATDLADTAQVNALFADMAARMPPLRGVVHSAAVLDDGLVINQSVERALAVMDPKVLGAWNLHQHTRAMPLQFFVLYSSAAGFFGSPGQGTYAAANAYLDALAHGRRQQGLPGVSINWGPFSEVGLAAAQDNRGARLNERGSRSITPAQGHEILALLWGSDVPQCAVVAFDPAQWAQAFPQRMETPWMAGLRGAGAGEAAARPKGFLRDELASLSPEQAVSKLEDYLRGELSSALRVPLAKVQRDGSFKMLGVDSLIAMELRGRLEHALVLRLSATLVWSHPTLAGLASVLFKQMQQQAVSGDAPAAAAAPQPNAAPAAAPAAEQDRPRG